MLRGDPGDHFDAVGWSRLTMADKVENEYVLWGRKDSFADAPWDSGTGDNINQRLSPRVADKMWPY
jgi:hypothetical protein